MNTKKILLVNVSKGRIGEDNSAILGAMIITKIQLSAMERVRIPEDQRKDFYLYVDEFQNFATDSFVNILSEARKYRLDLIIAHQYIGQLVTETSTAVRDAVFGNVGTMVSFRVGATDAEFLEQEFTPEFLQEDLIRLDNYNIYIKLMIDGITSRPFSATTFAPAPVVKDNKKRREIIEASRQKYSRKVRDVENEINRWATTMEVPARSASASKAGNLQGRPGSGAGRPQADGTTLYDTVCSNCGKTTKVVFPPTEGRAVYCKSCLKKMKKPDKSPAGHFDGPVTIPPSADLGGEETGALEELGIEFGPASPSQGGPAKKAKIEEVSFNAHRDRGKDGKPARQNPPSARQKKEINLADLKKALEESLEKKDKPAQSHLGNEAGGKSETPQEELEKRREEEKYEDKSSFPGEGK
jgi:CxxC-x17-CxxC domain-containing protein